jgi:hypothetical protein
VKNTEAGASQGNRVSRIGFQGAPDKIGASWKSWAASLQLDGRNARHPRAIGKRFQ